MKFSDYIKLKEDELPKDVYGVHEGDIAKLQRFILQCLINNETFHQLQPQLLQIANQDRNGELADILHGIDWQSLRTNAKKMINKLDNKEDLEDEDDDEPISNRQEKSFDRVKVPHSDMGGSDDGSTTFN
jgi:hypothetical protein